MFVIKGLKIKPSKEKTRFGKRMQIWHDATSVRDRSNVGNKNRVGKNVSKAFV